MVLRPLSPRRLRGWPVSDQLPVLASGTFLPAMAVVLAAVSNPNQALLKPEVKAHCLKMADQANAIERVASEGAKNVALKLLGDISEAILVAEESKGLAKRPFIDANRRIQEAVDEVGTPMEKAKKHLKALLGAYAKKLADAAAAEAKRQNDELERLNQARLQAEAEQKAAEQAAIDARNKAAADIEAARVRAEEQAARDARAVAAAEARAVAAEKAALDATNAKQAAEAQAQIKAAKEAALAASNAAAVAAEQARVQAEEQAAKAAKEVAAAEAAVEKSQEAILQADVSAMEVISTANPMPQMKSANAKVAVRWKTVVNDPKALFKVFPELCEVTAKMRDVNAAVARMADENPNEAPALPGCVITQDYNVSSR